jgi:drug/metabolite transporter (DMT)-like permease
MPRSLMTPLAAFVVALAWSGGWIAGKLGVTGAPPLEFSAVRFVIAALALAVIALVTRTRIRSGGLVPIVLSAVFGYLGYNAFVFVGLTMAPASDAALIGPDCDRGIVRRRAAERDEDRGIHPRIGRGRACHRGRTERR